MLTPEYLSNCTDALIELYSKLDETITRDITRRIVKTGTLTKTAKWQKEMSLQSGQLYDEIINRVSEYSGKSKAAVRTIFANAGDESVSFDNEIYEEAGLNPRTLRMSPNALKILEAGIAKTDGLLRNLTMTTADAAQQAFIDACSLAELQITSGAFDYNTAIRNAVSNAIDSGAEVIYPSGHRDKLDVAIRRSVMTGVSQTTGKISLAYAKDMGTDLMEINAHGGARPSHAEWQGKVVSLSGKKGYKSLDDIGYGELTGFKGYNCRHDWYPYFEGISTRAYTDRTLDDIKTKKVEYEGATYSQYEAEQIQRSIERKVRDTKRQLAGYDEAIKVSDSDELSRSLQAEFDQSSNILKSQEKKYNEFCKTTGLTAYKDRLQAAGFNKSTSSKAVAASKKKLPKVATAKDIKLDSPLDYDIGKGISGIIPKGADISKVRIIAGYGTSTEIRSAKLLSDKYQGYPLLWEKKGGIITTDYREYDVHWYEYNGKQYDSKVKLVKEVKKK